MSRHASFGQSIDAVQAGCRTGCYSNQAEGQKSKEPVS